MFHGPVSVPVQNFIRLKIDQCEDDPISPNRAQLGARIRKLAHKNQIGPGRHFLECRRNYGGGIRAREKKPGNGPSRRCYTCRVFCHIFSGTTDENCRKNKPFNQTTLAPKVSKHIKHQSCHVSRSLHEGHSPSEFLSSANSANQREADGEIGDNSRGLADENSARFAMRANPPARFRAQP